MDSDDELEILVDNAFERVRRRLFTDFLLLGLMIIAAYVAGVVYLGWFIWKEIKLEKSFFDRYGQIWQEEYQKYFGSLAQAHLKIAVCLTALVGVTAVGCWFLRQGHRGQSKRRQG
jgi:hypothetical protein